MSADDASDAGKWPSRWPVRVGQFIGNKIVESKDAAVIDVENPTTHEKIGIVPAGCAADAEAALELAKAAQPAWAKKPAATRAELLKSFAKIIRDNRDELIDILMAEQAKIKPLATVEIDVTATYFDYYAGLARSYEGEIVNSDNAGEHIYVHYAPIGVAVGICPWNFPFFVMARKLAPALLTGCAVVVKASEVTPLTTLRFGSLLERAVASNERNFGSETTGVR